MSKKLKKTSIGFMVVWVDEESQCANPQHLADDDRAPSGVLIASQPYPPTVFLSRQRAQKAITDTKLHEKLWGVDYGAKSMKIIRVEQLEETT